MKSVRSRPRAKQSEACPTGNENNGAAYQRVERGAVVSLADASLFLIIMCPLPPLPLCLCLSRRESCNRPDRRASCRFFVMSAHLIGSPPGGLRCVYPPPFSSFPKFYSSPPMTSHFTTPMFPFQGSGSNCGSVPRAFRHVVHISGKESE